MDINQIYTLIKSQHPMITDDQLQDVVIKIWQSKDTFDERLSAWSTWVYNLTKRYLIDEYRREKVFKLLPIIHYEDSEGYVQPSIDLDDAEPNPLQILIDNEEKNMIIKKINQLPPTQRKVMEQYFSDGTYEGSDNDSTQRVYFLRAKTKLKKKIKQYNLRNVTTGKVYATKTLKESADIVGCTVELVRQALNENKLFFKKEWRIVQI